MRIDLLNVVSGLALAVAICYAAYLFRALSISGAVAAAVVGGIIFGFGGIAFAVPLLFFFLSSSLLSKTENINKRNSQKISARPGPRTAAQVFANGGPALIFVIAYAVNNNPIWFIGYLSALCESSADTWATEIGTLSKTPPYSLITWRPKEAGESGAITFLGTLAALTGSLTTMGIAYLAAIFFGVIPHYDFPVWASVVFAGFIGALIDSLLGGTLQARFNCQVCQKTVEDRVHCGKPSAKTRGLDFIDNDMVNFISSLLAAILGLWLVI